MSQHRSARDISHPHAHYVNKMKLLWRSHASHLHRLLLAANECDARNRCHPDHALFYCGQDDKATVPVGRHIPIAAGRQSNRVMAAQGSSVLAADHDWHAENLIPSVIHKMNITNNAGESLFSGGVHGNGRTYVSVHKATFDRSDCFKHCTNTLELLEQRALNGLQEMPLLVHIDCDGGTDHNPEHTRNIMAYFALFKKANIDKLSISKCVAGLSSTNTAERANSILNLGHSGLALVVDPNAPEFLVDLIQQASSRKQVWQIILQYDQKVPFAVDTLKRRLAKVAAREASFANKTAADDKDNTTDAEVGNESNNNGGDYGNRSDGMKVGRRIRKFFPQYRWFMGSVTEVVVIQSLWNLKMAR